MRVKRIDSILPLSKFNTSAFDWMWITLISIESICVAHITHYTHNRSGQCSIRVRQMPTYSVGCVSHSKYVQWIVCLLLFSFDHNKYRHKRYILSNKFPIFSLGHLCLWLNRANHWVYWNFYKPHCMSKRLNVFSNFFVTSGT